MRMRCVLARCIGAALVLLGSGVAATDELVIGLNFTGSTLHEDSPHVPPDTMGAVGPDHIVELINGRYSVYRKSDGARVQTSTLNEFWIDAGIPEIRQVAFDPRVLYDPDTARWFAVSVDNARADSAILVAASASADPTEGWAAVAIDADPGDVRWADFPTLGINGEGVFIGVTMPPVTSPPYGLSNTLVVVSKQDLLSPPPLIPVVSTPYDPDRSALDGGMSVSWPESAPDTIGPVPGPQSGTPRTWTVAPDRLPSSSTVRVTRIPFAGLGISCQPVVDLDNGGLPLPILFLTDFSTVDEIRRGEVRGEIQSPTLAPWWENEVIPITRYPAVNAASQPPPKRPVEIFNAGTLHSNIVLRAGTFWGVHTVASPGPALRWFRIDAETSELLEEGIIAGEPGTSFFYGAIAVNEFGDVVIGFNATSATQFISSYAVLGRTVDGVTTFGAPVLLQAGQAGYEVIRRNGRNRWGDYSATVVDPTNRRVFWTFQEYVSNEDVWSTGITQLIVITDGDGDGVPDEEDHCPESDLREFVVVDDCRTGVDNVLDEAGCTISDRIAECANGAGNHGRFVSCVARVSNDLKWEGALTGRSCGAIRSCAARAVRP